MEVLASVPIVGAITCPPSLASLWVFVIAGFTCCASALEKKSACNGFAVAACGLTVASSAAFAFATAATAVTFTAITTFSASFSALAACAAASFRALSALTFPLPL